MEAFAGSKLIELSGECLTYFLVIVIMG